MEARRPRVRGAALPSLAGAPIVGSRVCQYDLTTDTHFLVARHPEHASWWLVGGGSGHGFKHGPALGEYVADCIEGRREPEPFHGLGARAGHAGLRTADTELSAARELGMQAERAESPPGTRIKRAAGNRHRARDAAR